MCMLRVFNWSLLISSVCFYLAAVNGIKPGCMCTDKAFINKDVCSPPTRSLCLKWCMLKIAAHISSNLVHKNKALKTVVVTGKQEHMHNFIFFSDFLCACERVVSRNYIKTDLKSVKGVHSVTSLFYDGSFNLRCQNS